MDAPPFYATLLERLEETVRAAEADILSEVARWFAYAILFETRVGVSHHLDPEWDHSGTLEAAGQFELAEHKTLGDFLDERNGESEPTFESGHGMHHRAFEDELEELLRNSIGNRWERVLEEPAVSSALAHMWEELFAQTRASWPRPESQIRMLWEIDEEIDREPAMDLEQDLVSKLQRKAASTPCVDLFASGEERAREHRVIQEIEEQGARAREADQRAIREGEASVAADVAARMTTFLESDGIRPSQKIGRLDATWRTLGPWIEQLSEHERTLLLAYGPFSQSVRRQGVPRADAAWERELTAIEEAQQKKATARSDDSLQARLRLPSVIADGRIVAARKELQIGGRSYAPNLPIQPLAIDAERADDPEYRNELLGAMDQAPVVPEVARHLAVFTEWVEGIAPPKGWRGERITAYVQGALRKLGRPWTGRLTPAQRRGFVKARKAIVRELERQQVLTHEATATMLREKSELLEGDIAGWYAYEVLFGLGRDKRATLFEEFLGQNSGIADPEAGPLTFRDLLHEALWGVARLRLGAEAESEAFIEFGQRLEERLGQVTCDELLERGAAAAKAQRDREIEDERARSRAANENHNARVARRAARRKA